MSQELITKFRKSVVKYHNCKKCRQIYESLSKRALYCPQCRLLKYGRKGEKNMPFSKTLKIIKENFSKPIDEWYS